MSSLSIQIPDNLRVRIESLAAEGGFDTVEAYVEAMIRADAAIGPVTGDNELEMRLDKRVDGPFIDVDETDLRNMRSKLNAKLDETDLGNAK